MNHKLSMSFLAEPTDVNFGGNVHGGMVMKWMDQAGYALAVRYSNGYAVTKFVDNIEFINPIYIGDLVRIDAEIFKTGTTSMNIKIEVSSENLKTQSVVSNCSCIMVFVAIDADGKKRALNN
jgi:acyl-CoA hydrolase